MKTVWKFDLPVGDETYHIPMPKGAKVLKVGHQGNPGLLQIWCEVVPINDTEPRRFRVYGTGHLMEDHLEWVDTVPIMPEESHVGTLGPLVWNIYEVTQ